MKQEVLTIGKLQTLRNALAEITNDPKLVIAGGAVRDILHGIPSQIRDIDVFVHVPDNEDPKSYMQHYVTSVTKANHTLFNGVDVEVRDRNPKINGEYGYYVQDVVINGYPPIQFIGRKFIPTVGSLLETFHVNVSKCAINDLGLYVDSDALSKSLRFVFPHTSLDDYIADRESNERYVHKIVFKFNQYPVEIKHTFPPIDDGELKW